MDQIAGVTENTWACRRRVAFSERAVLSERSNVIDVKDDLGEAIGLVGESGSRFDRTGFDLGCSPRWASGFVT